MPDRPGRRQWVYAGFWVRVWAAVIDSILLVFLLFPLIGLIPGAEHAASKARVFTASGRLNYDALSPSLPGPLHIVLYWVLPAAIVLVFWWAREATPGKMAIHARIVDARSGGRPTTRQYVIRYLGYYVSSLACGLGLIWVGIDARKQGWHDKLAHTVVVRPRALVDGVARFEDDEARPRATGWMHE